jgi:hypothetical protein
MPVSIAVSTRNPVPVRDRANKLVVGHHDSAGGERWVVRQSFAVARLDADHSECGCPGDGDGDWSAERSPRSWSVWPSVRPRCMN